MGDVNLNLYDLKKACEDIRKHFLELTKDGCIPLALGGDHTMTYPILQALKVQIYIKLGTTLGEYPLDTHACLTQWNCVISRC